MFPLEVLDYRSDWKTILLKSCSPITSAAVANSLSFERFTAVGQCFVLHPFLFPRSQLQVLPRLITPNKQLLLFSSDFWVFCLPLFPGRHSIALQNDWYTKGRGASCYPRAATSGWRVRPARPSRAWAQLTDVRLSRLCACFSTSWYSCTCMQCNRLCFLYLNCFCLYFASRL